MRQGAWPQAKAGQSGAMPLCQEVRQLLGGSREDQGVAGVLGTGELVQAALAGSGTAGVGVEEDDQVRKDVYRLAGPASLHLGGMDLAQDRSYLRRAHRGDKADVGRAAYELKADGPVGQGGDNWVALRRARCDRGPFHREPAALEVDVVQFLAVDEPARRDVADLGVVLPAVPQSA